MSSPQLQNASQVFRKPAAPAPKPMTPTHSVGPQGGLHSDTYAVGVFTPAPQAPEAQEVISSRPAGSRRGGAMKKWWVVALIISLGFLLLALGLMALDTEVLRKGKLTPEQEEFISERYGMIGGFLFGVTWVIAFLVHRARKQ